MSNFSHASLSLLYSMVRRKRQFMYGSENLEEAKGHRTIKALSLWQPWASLIYDGRKTIETRSWEMFYRGPLAIHAAMHVEKDACEDFGYDWRTIPRGAILCIVGVQGCVRFPNPLAPPDAYGDFYEGRYGILMTMLEKFAQPIPAKGHQGIWNWERGA